MTNSETARQALAAWQAKKEIVKDWCTVDNCPPPICGGPHYNLLTTFGIETVRADQEPIGKIIYDD